MSKNLFEAPAWDNDLPANLFTFNKKSKGKQKNKNKINLPPKLPRQDNEPGKYVRIKQNSAITLTDGAPLNSGTKRKIKQNDNVGHEKSAPVPLPLKKQRKTLNHTGELPHTASPISQAGSKELKLKRRKFLESSSHSQSSSTLLPSSLSSLSSVSLANPQTSSSMIKKNKKAQRRQQQQIMKLKNANVGNESNLQVGEKHRRRQQIGVVDHTNSLSSLVTPSAAPVSFREKLIDNLKGSRFRFLNEMLYTIDGQKAVNLFKEDPDAFGAYHDGYRQQVEQWPLNPLDKIIKSIAKLPKDYIVADFGCGDGRLAKSILQKTYSLDLVAANDEIIACDMAATPLESESVNVVVFCLSLMGTNLKDFFLEANRVMKNGGILKIAEVESRFADVRQFIDNVQRCGFQLVSKDLSNNLFYFMNFKKSRNISKINNSIHNFSLKPCLYKKR